MYLCYYFMPMRLKYCWISLKTANPPKFLAIFVHHSHVPIHEGSCAKSVSFSSVQKSSLVFKKCNLSSEICPGSIGCCQEAFLVRDHTICSHACSENKQMHLASHFTWTSLLLPALYEFLSTVYQTSR